MRHALSFAALTAALAACSSTPVASPALDAAPKTRVTSESPTPVRTPTTPAEVPVGRTQISEDATSTVRVTVLRVRQPLPVVVPGLPERKGNEYAGVEVRTCLTRHTATEPVSLGWGPWTLTYPDGVVVEALSAWSSEWWTVPLYPNGRQVREGRCVRGWIPFEARKGTRPQYGRMEPIRWSGSSSRPRAG